MNISRGFRLFCLIILGAANQPILAKDPFSVSLIRTSKELADYKELQSGFRVHFIDVGTGLSVFIEGPDFNLMFDAGSADDKKGNSDLGSKNRVVAYLNGLLGSSGSKQRCVTLGDANYKKQRKNSQIDYLFLSHPHEDHMSHLPSVLECFGVTNVFEPGIFHDTVGYKNFRKTIFDNKSITYLTAVTPLCSKDNGKCAEQFSIGDEIKLGSKTSAKARVLHVGKKKAHDPNSYSIVLRVDLENVSVLLTGDAESGNRVHPSSPVGHAEKYLLENQIQHLKVDILQVAHHGSLTSSRQDFIKAVAPSVAVISSGPKKYGSVVLPDPEIEHMLIGAGATLYNTNLSDKDGCPVLDKVGTNERTSPGGCDNYVIEIGNSSPN